MDVADHFFPPVHKLQQKHSSEYSQVEYWRDPLPEISPIEVQQVMDGTTSTSLPEKQSSWRGQHITSQHQLRGNQRRRYNSTPAGSNVLPSHNSIDMYDQSEDDDDFRDIGMEMNLSETRRRKAASLWAMPFSVNSLFI